MLPRDRTCIFEGHPSNVLVHLARLSPRSEIEQVQTPRFAFIDSKRRPNKFLRRQQIRLPLSDFVSISNLPDTSTER